MRCLLALCMGMVVVAMGCGRPSSLPPTASNPQQAKPGARATAATYSGFSSEELVERLDAVRYTMASNPGGVSFIGDPIFDALCRKGDGAVDPLIKAYDTDDRKTAQTYPPRFPRETPNHIEVKSIAYQALMRILDASEVFGGGQRATPQELRDWWTANRIYTPLERHMRVLADDHATQGSWVEAARRLTDPEGSTRYHGWTTGGRPGASNPPPRMIGEKLRSNRNPSMTELMIKRVRQYAQLAPYTPGSPDALPRANEMDAEQMADMLSLWDPKAAMPVLQEVTRQTEHDTVLENYGSTGPQKVRLFEDRADLGDPTALSEYAEWIVKPAVDPKSNFFPAKPWFIPFAAHPNDPALQAAVKTITDNDDSPWNRKNLALHGREFICSPLLAYKEFFDTILAELSDTAPNGKVTRSGPTLMIESGGGMWSVRMDTDSLTDSTALADHTSQPLRTCDCVAMELAHLEGAPTIKSYRPAADRDAEIKTLKSFLVKNRSKVAKLLVWPNDWHDQPDFEQLRRVHAHDKR